MAAARKSAELEPVTGGMDDAPFCFGVVDAEMRLRSANRALRQLLGAGPEGIALELFPQLSPELVSAVGRAVQGESVCGLEIEQAGGQHLVDCYPVWDAPSSPSGAAFAFRDITSWIDVRRRGERLQRVSAELSGAARIDEIADLVLRGGREVLDASAGAVALLTEDGAQLQVMAMVGLDDRTRQEWRSFPLELHTPMGDAVRGRAPVFVDAGEGRDERYADLPIPADVASASVPLMVADRVLGGLSFRFDAGRTIDSGVRGFVIALGNQCAQAIDRALLYQADAAARLRAERLADIAVRLAAATEPGEVAELTAEAGLQVLGASASAVVRVTGERLEIMSSRGYPEPALAAWRSFDRDDDAPLAECIREGRPIFLDSPAEAARYPALAAAAERHVAWAAVPLIAHGQVLGALALSFDSATALAGRERVAINTLAAECAHALDRAVLSRHISQVNQRLEAALEAGNMGWWEWDSTSGRVVWSQNLERIYGLEPGTFGGTYDDFLALVHPDDRETVSTRARAGLDGEGHEAEHRIVTPDGRTRWIDGRSRVDRDAEGRSTGLGGIAIDITKRKLVELALRESDARFRGLFESGVLGVSGGCGLLIDEANDALLELIGYSRDDLGERAISLDRLIVGEGGGLLTEVEWNHLLEPGWLAPHERQYRRKDGSSLAVLFAAAMIDAPSRRWIGYALDLTERKRDEAALRFLADASDLLSESLDYQRTLQRLAELVVPRLADWCIVAVLGDDGVIRNLAVAHTDPQKVALVRQLEQDYPSDPDAPTGAPAVIRTGHTEYLATIPDELLVEVSPDERLLGILRDLGLRSVITAPLTARGRTFGALSMVIAESGRSYTESDVQLVEDLAHRAALAIDNARLFRERSAIADTLQASLLPPILPKVPGFDVAAEYVPGGDGVDVGGDFYDLFSTGDGRWAVVIGDVCGKGAVAATLTGVTRHTARASAIEDDDPLHVLGSVNTALLRTDTDGQIRFCTAVVGRLETGSPSRLQLARAGHPPPLVRRRNGTVEELGAGGTLLGVYSDPELRSTTTQIESGDVVVLYTDGVTDSWRDAGGDARLVELLVALPGESSAVEVAQRIRADAIRARGSVGDDMAVLVLRAM